MARFPACRSHPARSRPAAVAAWLASEPFRLFFPLGVLWSLVGVLLWPAFYAGAWTVYPGLTHARLMIEGFGGAFVLGFLGTAGPRMAGAPRLTVAELVVFGGLHQAVMLCHLTGHVAWGDRGFALLLLAFLIALGGRAWRWGKASLPAQLILAWTGLLCGSVGAWMLTVPAWLLEPETQRLASLLLHQGLLLPPVLGIGSFLFPRLLGAAFGEARSPAEAGVRRRRAWLAAILLVGSLAVEASGAVTAGVLLRALVAVVYLAKEVTWRRAAEPGTRGTLTAGLFWALGLGLLGWGLAAAFPAARVGAEHLLYVGGFGLLMLVIGSRVLCGHSGEIAVFAQRSWIARWLVFLVVLAAATRATTGFLPQLTVSHHIYAALTWAGAAALWLVWHRRRFAQREAEEPAPDAAAQDQRAG